MRTILRAAIGVFVIHLMLIPCSVLAGKDTRQRAEKNLVEAREELWRASEAARAAYEELAKSDLFPVMQRAVTRADVKLGTELYADLAAAFKDHEFPPQSPTHLGIMGACKMFRVPSLWLGRSRSSVSKEVNRSWELLTALWDAKQHYDNADASMAVYRQRDNIREQRTFVITYPGRDGKWNGSVSGVGAPVGQRVEVYIRTAEDVYQGVATVYADGSWVLDQTQPVDGETNTIYAKLLDGEGAELRRSNEVEVFVGSGDARMRGAFGGTLHFLDGRTLAFDHIGSRTALGQAVVAGRLGDSDVRIPFGELRELYFDRATRHTVVVVDEAGRQHTVTNAIVATGRSSVGYDRWRIHFVYSDPVTRSVVEATANVEDLSHIVIAQ
jgi:hypothetical protein